MPITAHIVVQGAERAVEFYRDAFGAQEVDRMPVPGGRLMSVQLRIGDGLLHVADEFPEMGVLAPPSIGGTPVVLALDVADADAVFAQAIAAGAEVRQPVQDMFCGDRHGQLDDPFGHRWNISQHLRCAARRGRRGRRTGVRLRCVTACWAAAGCACRSCSSGR
jgi:PhnB protein